ncbi:morphogenesis protein [Blastomyces dermatitidis ATCC 18188]|uniref:Morphogenesis protein n=1 Tax=Ajellomyces dermatitidis (strain ATCC 18188 / CBS 674.68) TaxID=653446 RepID=F2T1J3_AJEDA|nr:morphogenesis protein [Blastomyces dermatitidis ATCC 18188]
MSFFSRVFRSRDASGSKKQAKHNGVSQDIPQKPQWTDAFLRTEVTPDEIQELLHGCTVELKSRGLEIPFLLLPFRPSSDPSSARTFIRHYFSPPPERPAPLRGEHLLQELRLTEPMVLCSIMKWCWSRLPGGVVTWEAYELFKVGEQDSQFARDAFSTFIPLSVESDARTKIIFDFFDLMSAVAAHGKTNGFGGRKLSRYAGWWAFEHVDTGNGFESSYKNWASAADATSHLFFAYLRSLSPDSLRGSNGISALPISLQSLVQATEYPPETPALLQMESTKVVMIVDTVSPTPFALLRRAKNFEYRDSDHALQKFSNFEDPVRALTDECRRVLRCISSTNQSNVIAAEEGPGPIRDPSWSRFEDLGFTDTIEEGDGDEDGDRTVSKQTGPLGLRSAPHSRTADLGRPTTPSWADFLSSGFADENEPRSRPPFLLPPDKVLPPIQTVRGQSSQSHKRLFDQESSAEPGELASITNLDLDASFWWVWISSLSGEEPTQRKAVFGRCALIETSISGGKWFVLEEQVKGAAPEPEVGAYIAEKKSFFGFRSRKGRLTRRKSSVKKISTAEEPYQRANSTRAMSKTSIGPDQHARIQAAAAALQRKHREQEKEQASEKRNRSEDLGHSKNNSVMSLQPLVMTEVSQAMKWANNYDKNAVRAAYLGNSLAGTGAPAESLQLPANGHVQASSLNSTSPRLDNEQAVPPKEEAADQRPAAEQSDISKNTASDLHPVVTPVAEPTAPASVGRKSPEMTRSKKSMDSTEEPKKLKKKAANTTLKGMFGKKAEKPEQPPMKPTGVETSAVAAAKAALEGRTAQAAKTSTFSPTKAPAAHRLSGLGRKKTAESIPAQTMSKPVTPPATEEPKQAPQPVVQPVPAATGYDGPPWTRRDSEFDALSRVDTNEKAQADREFSSFDHQAPFVDQPAFVPEDTSIRNEFPERDIPAQHPASKQAGSPINGHGRQDKSISDEPLPLQDRWAQIRKNAAERAVHVDDHPSRSHEPEKTDDGETSGEETIESRVARIKARVAELTGNMES